MNKVTLIGRLGNDPELKYTNSGRAVCEVSIATNERFMVEGEQRTRTEWHRLTIWGDRGEAFAKFLTKGRNVCVEGALRTTSYQKDGEDSKRFSTKIEVRNWEFVDANPNKNAGNDSVGDDDSDSLSETEVPI